MYKDEAKIIKANNLIEGGSECTCATGLAFKISGKTDKVLLQVSSPEGFEIKMLASDNVLCGGDKILSFEADEHYYYLDIGTYIQTSGEYRGCVVFTPIDDEVLCFMDMFELI